MRRAQRATWFPLLVFAAVTFAAIPAYHSGPVLAACAAVGAVPRVTTCTEYSLAGFVYWPIALVLAYVAIATFYIRRSQARGVGTRARPYVIAGIILALAMTGAALWTLRHPLVAAQDSQDDAFGDLCLVAEEFGGPNLVAQRVPAGVGRGFARSHP